jgi:hypothetical protein
MVTLRLFFYHSQSLRGTFGVFEIKFDLLVPKQSLEQREVAQPMGLLHHLKIFLNVKLHEVARND